MTARHILTLPGGRRVHYRRCGQGPVLLMVHQSPRSSAEYAKLMERWGDHFTCIAPDTPGFGQSDPLPGEPEIGDFADALVEFLDALGVQHCPAYGFHSGGIILMEALKRHPDRFARLAIGGYAVWTAEELALFGARYLPPFEPQPYGEHLVWLWNRMLEQSWFFPWFDLRDEARLSIAHADVGRVHQAVSEMLDAGDAYRVGYRAVLRAPRAIAPAGAEVPPVLITAYNGDPLQPHIDRLGEMPAGWAARRVATPAQHEEESLAFLRKGGDDQPCPVLAEDEEEGWLKIDGGLIHWRGERGAQHLLLHAPAAEMAQVGKDELAIDAPGHGLSDEFENPAAAIRDAMAELDAAELRAADPPPGNSALLYLDLTPDRFGAHLLRAWSAARAEALFRPWYQASVDAAIPVEPAALEPNAIARRARARLRAGDAARPFHHYLASLKGAST